MVKYIKGKNRLKDLIYIQENKPCSDKSVDGIVRSLLSPIFENPETSGIVFYRFNDKDKFSGLLKRLEYTSVKSFDYSKGSALLKDELWENTEFLYVLTPRYGSSFIYDYDTEDTEHFAGYYLLHNSVTLRDSFEIIEENSLVDISEYKEQFKPDRRDNFMMNSSIRKIVDLMNESSEDSILADMQKDAITKNEDLVKRLEFLNSKSRYVVHEIRNQLSICELYANIIEKRCQRKEIENCINDIDCIKSAVKIANSALMGLKTLDNNDLQVYNAGDILKKSVALAKVYAKDKDIEFKVDISDEELSIFADESKFLAVLVNLLKNACEAIKKTGKILVKVLQKEDFVSIIVANDGEKIPENVQNKIFNDGYTSKSDGNGVGLYICQKNLEEQFARLSLLKSDEKSTEFEILISKV